MTGKLISRRRFLKGAVKTSAATITFPYLVQSSALGGFGTVAASNRIVIGCIGTGWQGTYNLRAFLGRPIKLWYVSRTPEVPAGEAQVVAVCDVDAARRDKAKQIVNETYGNNDCAAYNDFRELLARDDIDAVTVCTPDHWHGLMAVAAAKAGKDIYCEKPLAYTVAEGRAVCEAVKRYGRVLQTGSHERSGGKVRFACELVRNGRIGQLHTIWVNMPVDVGGIETQPIMEIPAGFDYEMWLGPAPWAPYTEKRCHRWFRFIMDYSGGEIGDRGAHIFDIAQLGNGSDCSGPIEISGCGEVPSEGLFDTFIKYRFECKYANGVRLIGESEGPRGIRFEGSDGWIFIHIHGGDLEASSESLLKEKIRPDEICLGRSRGHHEDFLNAVRTRGQAIAPAEVGHRSASICHLVNIAMLTGRKLQWDPVKELIINDSEANRMLSRPMRSPWYL